MIGIGIVKQSKANTLDVANGVKKKIEEIVPRLPRGMVMKAAYDSSLFIQESINDVVISLRSPKRLMTFNFIAGITSGPSGRSGCASAYARIEAASATELGGTRSACRPRA